MLNIIKMLAIRGISSLSTLFFTFLSTYLYGVSAVGSFAIFLSISSFIFLAIKFGMEFPLFTDLAKAKEINKFSIIDKYSNLQNRLAILFFLIFAIISLILKIPNFLLMFLVGFMMSRIVMNSYIIRHYGSQNKFILLQVGNANFFGLIFLIIFYYFDINSPIVYSFVLGNMILLFFSHFLKINLQKKSPSFKNLPFELSEKSIINNSFIYFSMDIINNIFTWTPLFVIAILFSDLEQGIFLNISRIGSIFIILLFILETVVMKDIADFSAEKNFDNLNKIIAKPKSLVIIFGSIILFFFLFFGKEILRIIDIELFPYNFELILYSISQFLVILFGPLALFMKLSDNQTQIRNILFFNSIFHIVLSFSLSYFLGQNGVYFAIILGNLLWCFIVYRYIKNKYGFAL